MFAKMPSLPFLLLLSLTTASSAYLTPNPGGPYNVTHHGPLNRPHAHGNREWTPHAANTDALDLPARQLRLHNFSAVHAAKNRQIPNQVPRNPVQRNLQLQPLFLNAELPVCPENCEADDNEYPILLFQPGYSIPRLYYSALASSIASEGFVVVTIDSPDDADIIAYPDGSAVYNTNPAQTDAVFRRHLPARIADAKFVLDQLGNATAVGELLPRRGGRAFSTEKVAMFGHSLGGVAAVLTAAQDKRILGAANWDGTFVSPPPEAGVSQPTLLISHGDADATWKAAWPRLHGPKLWVNVANTTHESFSDVPSLLQAAGEGKELAAFGSLLGTIAPAEMRRILTAYTSRWMHDVFAGRVEGAAMHAKEAKKFPAVEIVRQGNL